MDLPELLVTTEGYGHPALSLSVAGRFSDLVNAER
jgi:hypothetical protein